MARNRRKKRVKPLGNIKENVVNLQESRELFAGFPLLKGAVNNLWDWNTLEDVKF